MARYSVFEGYLGDDVSDALVNAGLGAEAQQYAYSEQLAQYAGSGNMAAIPAGGAGAAVSTSTPATTGLATGLGTLLATGLRIFGGSGNMVSQTPTVLAAQPVSPVGQGPSSTLLLGAGAAVLALLILSRK